MSRQTLEPRRSRDPAEFDQDIPMHSNVGGASSNPGSVGTPVPVHLSPRTSPHSRMRVAKLEIRNFQGVGSAELIFDDKLIAADPLSMLVSTLYDALDIVLGPDRMGQYPAVEELDFYDVEQLARQGRSPQPLLIEVTLIDLTAEIQQACFEHLEFWSPQLHCLVQVPGQPPYTSSAVRCLRLRMMAAYNPVDAQCDADTYFPHGARSADGKPLRVDTQIKHMLGPLYRSVLRSGAQAMSRSAVVMPS